MSLALTGCASSGSSSEPQQTVFINPETGEESVVEETKYITFRLSVQGETEGGVFYCILMNAAGEPIQVDDVGTFTDVIRIYKPDSLGHATYSWYHRLSETDRILSPISEVDTYVSQTEDNSSFIINFPIGDTSVIFNNYIQSSFTVQAMVCDNTGGGELGRFIDCLGPDLSSSTHYSFTVNPQTGAVGSTVPAGYPNDMLYDCEEANIPANTPYINADLSMFSVEVH